jgi:integrase
MVDDFEEASKAKGEQTKRDLAIIAFLRTYAVPYFRRNKVTDLSTKEIARFFDWRRANSKKGKPPRETTVLHETSQLSTFLNWCHKRGYIDRQIVLEKPKHDGERRPHFDSKDWPKLTRFLREWVKEGRGISRTTLRDRVMLTSYVLILANTGLRVGEARGLRWRDIDTEPTAEEGEVNIILHVNGKTGIREVVARNSDVKIYLERIWQLRVDELDGKKPEKDGYVFCHPNGKPIHSFKKGFNTLISEAGVEFDREGDRRTIYSLRHTYATYRLQEGVNHYVLARNMGTSVKMLEQYYGHTSNRAMAEELTKHRAKKRVKMAWESLRLVLPLLKINLPIYLVQRLGFRKNFNQTVWTPSVV